MKLSIAFVSVALALSSSVANAAVLGHGSHMHHHHRRDHQNYGNNDVIHKSTITRYVTVVYGEKPVPTSTMQQLYKAQDAEYTTSSITSTIPTTTMTSQAQTTTAAQPTTSSGASDVQGSSSTSGLDSDFPDGECDCSDFPSAYGAVPIPWMNLGGWSGIQLGNGAGSSCVDGALCSYACPPGYSKAQWPDNQPADGESRGGLSCKGGKLYKTRSGCSTLCVAGHGGVTVKNELSEFVPICRTDYPGSEDMVIPLSCDPGSTVDLTVVDSANYYMWEGKPTSAQYYVNPAGTSLKDGCVWGIPNGNKGNWSPMVFGAGFTNGVSWLSISQNQLNSGPLGYNVEIVAGPNSELNGNCKYENGQFSGGGYGEQGCTCALKSGTAYFRLYK